MFLFSGMIFAVITMEKNICLNLNEASEREKKDNVFSLVFNDFSFLLTVEYYEIDELDLLFSDDEKIAQSIKANFDEFDEEDARNFKKIMKKKGFSFNKFYQKIESIELSGSLSSIKSFLKKNYKTINKKIMIANFFDYSKKSYEFLLSIYEVYPNIYISSDNNKKKVSISDYFKCYNAVNETAQYINSLNLSNFEKIILAYNIVRKRIYKLEGVGESEDASRSLIDIITGDKIVCEGYCRLLESILKTLNISSCNVLLKPTDGSKTAHLRLAIYIKDEKYDIDGIYYFDPTFDSKQNENDKNYLYGYKYFAKTRKQINELSSKEYIDAKFEDKFFEEAISDEDKLLLTLKVNGLKDEALDPRIISNTNFRQVKFEEDIQLFCKPIEIRKFLKAVFIVSKTQYYIDGSEIYFTDEALATILYYSGFEIPLTAQRALLLAIFGSEEDSSFRKEICKETYRNINAEEEFSQNIAQVKFVRTLKKVLNKKQGL